jgi:hypothetical protein
MTRGLAALFVLQFGLLTIGITRDYQLKHEDNNALHATFARSHLRLGLETTRGQNYFYSPATQTGLFYPNHPPGPALVLAAVYGLTGADGPAITRAVAIAFHMLATWLFLGLARRVLASTTEIVLALTLFIVLPESAFFGRMLNHEVLALPGAILLVRGYWEAVYGGWSRSRWLPAILGGGAWAAFSGWPGFFAIGACAVHAGLETFIRHNARARSPLIVLVGAGAGLFTLVIGHLLWILGGDVDYLRTLLASRAVGEGPPDLIRWIGRILELHWRYFGLTSAVALAAVAVRAARLRSTMPIDGAQEVALIFVLAGAGYVAAFAFNATKHDYWQFLLLPATALAVPLLLRAVLAVTAHQLLLRRALIGLAILDISVVTGVTLVQRHVKQEGYCLRVVAEMRRNNL